MHEMVVPDNHLKVPMHPRRRPILQNPPLLRSLPLRRFIRTRIVRGYVHLPCGR
jgi:hypothetical protein